MTDGNVIGKDDEKRKRIIDNGVIDEVKKIKREQLIVDGKELNMIRVEEIFKKKKNILLIKNKL